jgi:predicted esterase
MTRAAPFALLCAFFWLGCASSGAPHPAEPEPARIRPAGTPSSALALQAAPSLVQTQIKNASAEPRGTPSEPDLSEKTVALEVPEFSPAVVRLPDAAGPAPILVVAHGAGGTPEAHCDLWARISKGKALLLCVRGRARSPVAADGDYYPDHPSLERETFAALSALRARFADRIAPGPVFYAGFSQGATMGALMLVEHASEVTRLALVEGGFADWNVARARDFHARGGERVLFVCGRKECADPARNAAQWFNAAGVPARVEYVHGAGHSHDARMEARIAATYSWFTEGDARWQPSAGSVSVNTPR